MTHNARESVKEASHAARASDGGRARRSKLARLPGSRAANDGERRKRVPFVLYWQIEGVDAPVKAARDSFDTEPVVF